FAKEVDKAGSGVKLVPLEFRLDEVPMTIEVPEGAGVKDELIETRITFGDRFEISVAHGRRRFHLERASLLSYARPIVSDAGLILGKSRTGGFSFVTARTSGHHDFTVKST